MTTGATGQLGLALPVQGELSGTWGDTVNNGITQYTNIAIAATLTLTNDGAVTLANTTGDASASNITSSLTGAGTVTAQFAIVRVTGTLTTAKVITAPSYSKTYVVVNAATGGIVTFKASGQTGVSIAVGESAWVYYNGTDYVKIVGTATAGAAGGSNTQVQYNSSGSLAGSSNLTFDGTSLTLGGNPTLSAGTANGVTYLNGSKVLTSGSALVFDGSSLGIGTSSISGKLSLNETDLPFMTLKRADTVKAYFGIGNGSSLSGSAAAGDTILRAEQKLVMRAGGDTGGAVIDASGNLGLGVTPSAWDSAFKAFQLNTTGCIASTSNRTFVGQNWYDAASGGKHLANGYALRYDQIGSNGSHAWYTSTSGTAGNAISFTQAMTLDASGNLGVGATSPRGILDLSRADSVNAVQLYLENTSTSEVGLRIRRNGSDIGFVGTAAWSITGGGSTNFGINAVNALLLGVGSTERARIDSSGRLIIQNGPVSTSTSAVKGVQIYFDATNNQGYIYSTESGVANYPLNINASTMALGSTVTTFIISGTERARMQAGFSVGTTADPGAGAIYATGNITAYYSSDIKFKENVRDIPDALATVNAIGGKLFDWTDDYIESKGGADGYFVQKADFGVVAQDVQKVFPIAVRTREDGSLAVDYEKLGALAFAALVELTKRVEALEAK